MNLGDFRRARAEMIATGNLPERRRAVQAATGAAKVFVDDVIDSWGWPYGISSSEFRQTLDGITAEEIELHINSPGGESQEGVAMMNYLRDHPAKITAIVDGWAASAASVVMLGGDRVLMSPGSLVMIHDAMTGTFGDAAELRTAADFIEKVSATVAELYAAKTGMSVDEIRPLMSPKDTWLTAAEAIELGLVDGTDDTQPAAEVEKAKARASALAPDLKPRLIRNPISELASLTIARAGAALAAHKPPAEPGSTQPTEEVIVSNDTTLRDGVRTRLGVNDDAADDATILAALDEALGEQAEPAAATTVVNNYTPPEGTVLVAQGVLADLQAQAARGAEAYTRQQRDDREHALTAAVKAGQITPAERPRWQAKLEADPESLATLQGLPKGLVPVDPIGHDGAEPAVDHKSPGFLAFNAMLGIPQEA